MSTQIKDMQPRKTMDEAIDEFLKYCNGEIEDNTVPCEVIFGNYGDYIVSADGSTYYYAFTDTF